MTRNLKAIMLGFILIFLDCSTTDQEKTPTRISWDPANLEVTLGLGKTITLNASFSCSEDSKNIDLIVESGLRDIISVTPSHFDSTRKGISNNFSVNCSAPPNHGRGNYQGTISVRIGDSSASGSMSINSFIVDAAETIGPAGGLLTTSDGKVSLDIPAGALDSNKLITIEYLEGVDLGQLGKLFRLGPDGLEFNSYVSLIINYDEQAIPSSASESSLYIANLADFEVWERLENPELDINLNLVAGSTRHFSTYGVLYSRTSTVPEISLGFPLQGLGAYTASISAVFDHNTSSSYRADGKIISFSGEAGFGLKDEGGNYVNADLVNSARGLYGFKNICETAFYANEHYTGGGAPSFLYYDGHPGIDFNQINNNGVLAAQEGNVLFAGWENPSNHSQGFGFYIKIRHASGFDTLYGHLDDSSIYVSKGAIVTKGQIIALSGNTGSSSGPHLHFEVRNGNNIPVDPYGWWGNYRDPYYKRAINDYLWDDGQGLNYSDIPASYKCDRNHDGSPDEISGWLSFVEGNPEIPGDAKFIDASGGVWPNGFELENPIPLSLFNDGCTVTVFLPQDVQDFNNVSFAIVTKSMTEPCAAHFGVGGNLPYTTVAVNGVLGYVSKVEQQAILGWVAAANQNEPNCNLTIDDLYIGEVYVHRQGGGLISVLDALTIAPGQGFIPSLATLWR